MDTTQVVSHTTTAEVVGYLILMVSSCSILFCTLVAIEKVTTSKHDRDWGYGFLTALGLAFAIWIAYLLGAI